MRRRPWLASLFLFQACWVIAQTPGSSHRLTILLPPGIPSETVKITYALGGGFGSYGRTIDVAPNTVFQPIPTSVEGKAADGLQMVIWAPGCETRTYTFDLRKSPPRRIGYECAAHPTVTLTGRIVPFEPIRERNAEVVITYRADWECRFFGWNDCLVPQNIVAIVRPGIDGTFEARLPDLASDSIVEASAGMPGATGAFWIILRDPKTWNHIADLQPELEDYRSANGSLKSLSAYPSDLVFIADFTIK